MPFVAVFCVRPTTGNFSAWLTHEQVINNIHTASPVSQVMKGRAFQCFTGCRQWVCYSVTDRVSKQHEASSITLYTQDATRRPPPRMNLECQDLEWTRREKSQERRVAEVQHQHCRPSGGSMAWLGWDQGMVYHVPVIWKTWWSQNWGSGYCTHSRCNASVCWLDVTQWTPPPGEIAPPTWQPYRARDLYPNWR